MPKRGFTLIELLITISIIAVLAVIGLVIYTKFIQNARDAKRQADLRSIQSALEQYFADQFKYPVKSTSTTTCPSNGQFSIVTDLDCSFKDPTGTKTYMNIIPKDPFSTPANQYRYEALPSGCDNSSAKCTSYCLYADLENTSLTNSCQDLVGYDMEVSPP